MNITKYNTLYKSYDKTRKADKEIVQKFILILKCVMVFQHFRIINMRKK